jgi:hypothetical protein
MQGKEEIEIKELLARLLREPCHLFPARGGKFQASNRKGVYIIYSPLDDVLHVGSTPRAKGGLGQRLRDHLHGNSSFTVSHFRGDGSRLSEGYKYQYLVIDSGRQRALVEALGIGQLCPVHIGHGLDDEELDEKPQPVTERCCGFE